MSIERDRMAPAGFKEIARLCRARAHECVVGGDPLGAREWIKATEEALHVAELIPVFAQDTAGVESKGWLEELIDDRIKAHTRAAAMQFPLKGAGA